MVLKLYYFITKLNLNQKVIIQNFYNVFFVNDSYLRFRFTSIILPSKNNLESELKSHLHNLKQRNNFLEFQKNKKLKIFL